MDLDFGSLDELYTRITPALTARTRQLSRIGYSYITIDNIWDYLSIEVWPKSRGLTLSDMVSDIMHVNPKEVESFLRKKGFYTGRREYLRQNKNEVL